MKTKKLEPMPPNLGVMNYPLWEPITKVLDAIDRWKKGERAKKEESAK